jgi:hypothetical protein
MVASRMPREWNKINKGLVCECKGEERKVADWGVRERRYYSKEQRTKVAKRCTCTIHVRSKKYAAEQ